MWKTCIEELISVLQGTLHEVVCHDHIPKRATYQTFAAASPSDVYQGEDKGKNSASICLGRGVSIASLSVNIRTFADAVSVPWNCLQEIWNKAAELLKTDDAAAGIGPGAKLLGQNPHLVISKVCNFAWDSECPNWKALGTCTLSSCR